MTETGNSGIRALLQKNFIRIPLKLTLWLIVFATVTFVGAAAYNAFDEELSVDAKALLAAPPMGAIDDKNGYIAFLGMVAPKEQDQMEWGRKAAAAFTAQAQPGFTRTPEWKEAIRSHLKAPETQNKWCKPEVRDCLAEAKSGNAAIAKTLAEGDNALLLTRYRKVRDGVTFTDLYMGANPAADMPGYSAFAASALLSLAENSMQFYAGNLDAVVAELEREVAFHRRMIADGRSIITVQGGSTMLARDLLIISELLRSGGERVAPFRVRLSALTRPQVSAAALRPAFLLTAHEMVVFGHRIRAVLRDNGGWMLSRDLSNNMSPLQNWVLSLLVRPNATANVVAAAMTAQVSLANVQPAQFDHEIGAIRLAEQKLLERPWYGELNNPVGKGLAEVSVVGLGEYAARMHDLQALERMVDLQMSLAARGITETAAIAAFVAGEGAKSHPDPYAGKAFAFDPKNRLISFEPRATRPKGRWGAELEKRYGKAGIAL